MLPAANIHCARRTSYLYFLFSYIALTWRLHNSAHILHLCHLASALPVSAFVSAIHSDIGFRHLRTPLRWSSFPAFISTVGLLMAVVVSVDGRCCLSFYYCATSYFSGAKVQQAPSCKYHFIISSENFNTLSTFLRLCYINAVFQNFPWNSLHSDSFLLLVS